MIRAEISVTGKRKRILKKSPLRMSTVFLSAGLYPEYVTNTFYGHICGGGLLVYREPQGKEYTKDEDGRSLQKIICGAREI